MNPLEHTYVAKTASERRRNKMIGIIKAISIPVKTRGIGLDKRQGQQYKYERYQKNLAMFVNSKSDGEVVIEMLKVLLGARIGTLIS